MKPIVRSVLEVLIAGITSGVALHMSHTYWTQQAVNKPAPPTLTEEMLPTEYSSALRSQEHFDLEFACSPYWNGKQVTCGKLLDYTVSNSRRVNVVYFGPRIVGETQKTEPAHKAYTRANDNTEKALLQLYDARIDALNAFPDADNTFRRFAVQIVDLDKDGTFDVLKQDTRVLDKKGSEGEIRLYTNEYATRNGIKTRNVPGSESRLIPKEAEGAVQTLYIRHRMAARALGAQMYLSNPLNK